MSFIQAFLESGRTRGEHLEHLEGVQTVALETFAIDAGEIVEIFNRILFDAAGFSLAVQPVENFKTGLILTLPQAEGDSKSVYIDIGYIPQTQEYTVCERGGEAISKYQEFDMQVAVAEIIFKNLPDQQYIQFYRGLQNAAPQENVYVEKAPSADVVSFPPSAEAANPLIQQSLNHDFDEGQFVSIEALNAVENSFTGQEQSATVTPFPNSTMHQYQDVVSEIFEEDVDSIWEDDEDSSSGDAVSKHLSTDVNMR